MAAAAIAMHPRRHALLASACGACLVAAASAARLGAEFPAAGVVGGNVAVGVGAVQVREAAR